MRFTRNNWKRFFDNHHKSTTIRLKPQRIGEHNAWAGSYMHPELLGTFTITLVTSKLFKDLDIWDALNDGFNTLDELTIELKKLNPRITDDTTLYIHWIVEPVNKDKIILADE